MEDYTTDFYQLISRNEVHETKDQLVARYIGGLRVQIQETMNLFDPILVSAAHQRAVQIEKQIGRRSGSGLLTGAGSSTDGVSHAADNSGQGQRASGSDLVQHAPLTVTLTNKESTNGMRCFECGETSHRQADCKKKGEKALFVDPNDYEEEDAYIGEELVFDGTNEGDVEILEGDTGPALVVRRMCLTPHANGDEWLCNNIFQSTCTI